MAYFVYILRSEKDSSYYIGQTRDLERRLIRHNRGGGNFTKKKIPYRLIYSETWPTRNDAVSRERLIKSYKGGEAFKKLIRRE
jgi:putative endonuclease